MATWAYKKLNRMRRKERKSREGRNRNCRQNNILQGWVKKLAGQNRAEKLERRNVEEQAALAQLS